MEEAAVAPSSVGATRRPAAGGALFVAGVMLLALNLRPAVTSVPPILDEIGGRLGYSSLVLTVLTTVPVLCFGLFSPVAGWLGRRLGDEAGLGIAVLAVATGQVVRSLGPAVAFFPGTVVACAGIAVINVLLSSLVKRRAPERSAHLLGAYLAMLYLGAMAGSAASVPLYRAAHHSIRPALAIWAVPALLAVVLWVAQIGRRTRPDDPEPATAVRRSRMAWWVTGFMGLQSLTFYASLSILPDLYRSRGLDASTAGLVDTMLSAGGVVTAVVAPVLVARYGLARPVLIASAVLSVAATIAPLYIPTGAALPAAFLLGLGQGVSIALALYFIMARAATPAVAAALSSMAQGAGYLIAAAGPLVAGLLHSLTRSWGPSVAFLAAVTAATLWFGLEAARERLIGPR